MSGHRRVQRNKIGPGQEIIKFDLFNAEIECALGRKEGIERNHAHMQPYGAVGDDGANIATTDNSKRFGSNFNAHETVLFPFARLGRRVRRGNLAGERKHHRDGVFCRGDGIAEGRIHNNDAARGGCRNIDIIDAYPGTTDDFETVGGGEQFRRYFRRRADRQTIIIADNGEKLLLIEAGSNIHLNATLLENSDGCR